MLLPPILRRLQKPPPFIHQLIPMLFGLLRPHRQRTLILFEMLSHHLQQLDWQRSIPRYFCVPRGRDASFFQQTDYLSGEFC